MRWTAPSSAWARKVYMFVPANVAVEVDTGAVAAASRRAYDTSRE